MKKNLLSLSLSLFILFASPGCKPSNITLKNADQWIPEDFSPSKTVLLVEKYKAYYKVQQKMEDYMADKYPYRYEFVDKEVIENRTGKYANVKLYKYALIQTEGRKPAVISKGEIWGDDFCFYDRENNKKYPPTHRESSNTMMLFKPIINTIVSRN